MKPISPFGVPVGLSVLLWGTIGLIRLIYEKFFEPKRKRRRRYFKKDIAVIMAAHNEEVVIRNSIKALKTQLDEKQIYVASDGSNDKTYRRARMEGVHTVKLDPGKGKAKALIHLLEYFKLFSRYKLIFIVDADTQIDKNLLKRALPYLDDPKVAVIFSGTKIHWPSHILPRKKLYFVTYRDRLNRLLVYMYIYGQTWKYTSMNYVIPGSCVIYKSKVLKKLEIDTPGLLIEDFNLAFQVHRKKLGRIAFHPSIFAWEQYPNNLKDYWKQVRRWNIGFYQTARRNGVWPSFFWLSLFLFSSEVLLNAFFILFVPWLLIYDVLFGFGFNLPLNPISSMIKDQLGITHPMVIVFIIMFIMDYIETIIIAIIHKRYEMMMYGLAFFFMHYVTVLILFSSIIPGFFMSSRGRWISPTRREFET